METIASQAVVEASKILKQSQAFSHGFVGREVKLKQDQELDQFLRQYLEKNSPYKVYSEESLGTFNDIFHSTCWVVDPLDGSLNFLRDIPFYTISVSLWKEGTPVLGVIWDPSREELYTADINTGAKLNGQPIKVSDKNMNEAILATGIPSHAKMEEAINLFSSNAKKYKKLRWLGSASLSLAYVASGRVDAYQEHGIKIWDVGAGLALVKAAGGKFDFTINEDQSLNVFASNGRIG